jgi:molecular chaperone DnaK
VTDPREDTDLEKLLLECLQDGDEDDAPESSSVLDAPAPPAPKPDTAPAAPVAETPSRPTELAVGIDLGTTYSVVAFVDPQGRPVSVLNSSGDVLTPSVVLFDGDEIIVGKEAVAASALEPENVVECVKRDMGAKAYHRPIQGESMPPEVLSSLILRKLKADAERKLGPIQEVVITVPAYFDEPRRRATADAGRLAGLHVLDIVNEPTAAALAFGHQLGLLDGRGQTRDGKPLRALVYDLGGGTFDVSIVAIEGSHFRTLATDGDVLLGGKDWDEALVGLAAAKFVEQHGSDPRDDPITHQELSLAAEAAKRALSERQKAHLVVNHLGRRLKVEVTRAEFEEATAPLLGRTRTTTEIVVMQAGLSWAEIDRVLLVGGSTRMPMVARMLEELTGKVPDASLSADEAVAHGAALFAGLLLGRRQGSTTPPKFRVTNVNAHSLGLVGIDPATGRKINKVLIPKNTPLPKAVAQRFKTFKPNQKNVTIRVLEGESELPEACTQVGTCVIRGLPSDLPAGWPVEVRYSYEENGRLRVHGRLGGHEAAVTTEFIRVNNMTDDELMFWHKCLADRAGRIDG